jgi:hypothetical protein
MDKGLRRYDMKRPNFNEKTEVKFINPNSRFYGKRGKVAEIVGFDKDGNILEQPYSKENYPVSWDVHVSVDGAYDVSCLHWEDQLEAVQKKFVDIDYIRETDLVIGKKSNGEDAIRPKNVGAFEPGDIIQITTKIDGANASIAWDEASQSLEIFSRTNLLTSPGSLRGFYDYIKTEVEPKIPWNEMSKKQNLVIFGEWCVGHTVQYNKDWYNKWRIYDIFDKSMNKYWCQDAVKAFCMQFGLEYIEELYYGPFISWEHCRSFIGKSTAYGPAQEGVVIKNQSKLFVEKPEGPVYIKIVDEKFKEAQHSNKGPKVVDPVKEAEKQKAAELASTVVTEARVRKLILKLVDDGKLPAELKPTDMGAVMKLLPKCVFEDVLKEEPETMKLLGEYAGKCVAAETAKWARKIVIGG